MDWGVLLGDPRHPSYPVVRRIVADLERDFDRWCDRVREFEIATVNSTAAEPSETAESLEQEVRALAVDIQSYVAEIKYLGVDFDVQRLFREVP